ncbi:type IV pilus assembly protein FimV [Piscirickettsia litoralis]|uniref:type IV pilus assembly protein FimV n=1 Tax=Piscirickettsia litoralis TaxID=1891921 RepID=UPI001F33C198|nr:hypothetical protein [Piscirickettsia litoralis]
MKLLRLCVVAFGFALFSLNVFALSTGQISVFSEPREPLRAALVINHLGNIPYQKINVTMPTSTELRKLGLERSQMERLNFKVLPGRKGSALVYIHSIKPLPELSAIALDIRWPGGHKTEGFLLNLAKNKAILSETISAVESYLSL